MLCSSMPRRCRLIKRGRLKRSDRRPHQLLDRISGIVAIGAASRQARHAFRSYQRVVERSEQEVASPDDFGTRDVRQTFVDRIDEGMAGIVEGLRDDPARNFVALSRHDRAQPRETRSPAREIAA